MTPLLLGIDHIHVPVPDKKAAADWYRDFMGLNIVESLRAWDDDRGPLTLEDASGTVHLALFRRENYTPLTAVAFRVDGDSFFEWKRHLEEHQLLRRCVDHQLAWSLYFDDPFGHSHEITCYDHEYIRNGAETVTVTTPSATL